MAQTTDQLRQDLDRKRRDLSRDVDRIEDRVKSTFDLSKQVDERPLMSTGLAVGVGFIIGMMGGERRHDERPYPTRHYYRDADGDTRDMPEYRSRAVSANDYGFQSHEAPSSGSGLLSSVASGVKKSFQRGTGGSSFDDALGTMGAALMAVMVDRAKGMLDANLPGFSDTYERVEQQHTASGLTRSSATSTETEERQREPLSSSPPGMTPRFSGTAQPDYPANR